MGGPASGGCEPRAGAGRLNRPGVSGASHGHEPFRLPALAPPPPKVAPPPKAAPLAKRRTEAAAAHPPPFTAATGGGYARAWAGANARPLTPTAGPAPDAGRGPERHKTAGPPTHHCRRRTALSSLLPRDIRGKWDTQAALAASA